MAELPSLIVDTNVMLDIHSLHDLDETYCREFKLHGESARDRQSFKQRHRRAHESFALALYLNSIGAPTFSAHNELVTVLGKCVPKAPCGTSLRCDFTTFFLHFVKDRLLPGWDSSVNLDPETVVGEDVDDMLLAQAIARGVPLITNEGYQADGSVSDADKKKLRWKCMHAVPPVPVYTPAQFLAAKGVDEAPLIAGFFRRFARERPGFLAERRREFGKDKGADVVDLVMGYYRMILRGEFASPVAATVAHAAL